MSLNILKTFFHIKWKFVFIDALAATILQTTAAGKKVVNACVIGCAGRRDWDWPPLMARRPPQTGAAGG